MEFKKMRNIILIFVILAIIISVVIFAKNISVANAIKEQIVYEESLVENCECIEKERIKCFEGYELDGRFCRKEKKVTNVLRACSKYNCSGEIHNLE
tara:strand:+ start:3040 stop:3330 length:291 start_codon:yes stop_codon:yes gene_type:complete